MIQQFLRSVSLFQDLDDEELAQVLMVGLLERYAQESVTLQERAPGGGLHVIHTGRVRISKVVPGVGEEALTILDPAISSARSRSSTGHPPPPTPSPTPTARS